jgi:hypothetical protein|tara:strand:+ start:223 stop:522 length:300 start_codon:yes stop_codon:yes gene_type:complete
MRTPEQRMFLNVITQAIHDAAYKGDDRYYSYHRDQARAWLVSNSIDFRVICRLADLDPDYTHLKMSKALKSDIQQLRRNYYKKQKPERENRPGRYRLKF